MTTQDINKATAIEQGYVAFHPLANSYIDSLAILIPLGPGSASRAASHLVCAEVVKANPIPSPEEMDREMEEVNALSL